VFDAAILDDVVQKRPNRFVLSRMRRSLRSEPLEGRWLGADQNDGIRLFANGVKTTGLWEDHRREEGQRS
jgi:hypothetical protein